MAQKYLHGQVGGDEVPHLLPHPRKGKAPRDSLEEQAQEGMRNCTATRAGGLTLPLQGSHLPLLPP